MKTTNFYSLSLVALLLLGFNSCKKELLVNFDTQLSETKSLRINQTSGSSVPFKEVLTIELENSDTEEYLDRISSIENINNFTYQFKNFIGDPTGTISMNTLVNGVTIDRIENIVVKTEVENEKKFQITDPEKLNAISSALTQDLKVTFEFSGTAQCDAAPMGFDIELKMNVDVVANAL